MAVMTTLALMMAAGSATGPNSDSPRIFPVVVESGHFYLAPETLGGQRLKLLVDTGGGYTITLSAAKRLQLPLRQESVGGTPMTITNWPAFKAGYGVPLNPLVGHSVFVGSGASEQQGFDGVIGGPAFLGHAWTFDYANRTLTMQGKGWQPNPTRHRVALGFIHDGQGRISMPYPRITIHVNGAPVDMLLDTGATAKPTPSGERASATPTTAGVGVTSYITTSMFNQWHKAHPDWRIVEDGDSLIPHTRLIEVPRVDIADWSVGPVWFTERPDTQFHDVMSNYMDKQVEGSVGGNVFGHFVLTIDYVGEAAYFHCASGCKLSTPPPAP